MTIFSILFPHEVSLQLAGLPSVLSSELVNLVLQMFLGNLAGWDRPPKLLTMMIQSFISSVE